MNKKISEMINEYIQEKDFFGATSEKNISNAEEMLELRFPNSYRNFISNYGSGGICGVEIVGVEAALGASVVKSTERWRKLGLSTNLIVIEDSGEFVSCMYSADVNDERVFCWGRGDNKLYFRYNTFDDYMIDIFQEAIDNM